jgi:protein XagA
MGMLRNSARQIGLSALSAAALWMAGSIAPLQAGAWLQAESSTQIIFSNSATGAAKRFDRKGKLLRTDRFSKQETTVSAEHGWSDSVTLVAGLRGQNQTFTLDGAGTRLYGGSAGGGARVRLWSNSDAILSAQATVQASAERSLTGPVRRLEAPTEADFRLGFGQNIQLGTWPAFVDLQTAYRWRGGGKADELRLDATLGVRPLPSLLFLLQSFNTVGTSKARWGEGRVRQHKLQGSVVYDLSANWSLQVGVFGSLAGRDSGREQGFQIAWWRRL